MAQFSVDPVQALLPLEPVAARASLMEADRRGAPGFDDHLQRARRDSEQNRTPSAPESSSAAARPTREPEPRRDDQGSSAPADHRQSVEAKSEDDTRTRREDSESGATQRIDDEPTKAASDEPPPDATAQASSDQPHEQPHEQHDQQQARPLDEEAGTPVPNEPETQIVARAGQEQDVVDRPPGPSSPSQGDVDSEAEAQNAKTASEQLPPKVQAKPTTPAVDEAKTLAQPSREPTLASGATEALEATGKKASEQGEPQRTPSLPGAEAARESARPSTSVGEVTDAKSATDKAAARGQAIASATSEASGVANAVADGKQAIAAPESGTPSRPRSRNQRTSTPSINKQPASKDVAPPGPNPTSAQSEAPRAPAMDAAAASLAANDDEPKPSQATSQSSPPSSATDARQATPTVAVDAGQDRAPEQGADRAVRSESAVEGKEKATDARSTGESNLTQAERVRLVQRVARAFQVLGDGGGQVRLRLSPPELGSVRLDVTIRNGTMTAHLEAESAGAREALLDNLPALRERLAEQNIKLESFEVDLMKQSSQQAQDGPGDRRTSYPRDGAHGPVGSGSVGAAEETATDGEGNQSAPWLGNDRLNVVI